MIGDFDVECVTPSDDPDAGTNTLVFKYAAPKGTGIVEVVVKRRLSGWNTLLEVYVDGLLFHNQAPTVLDKAAWAALANKAFRHQNDQYDEARARAARRIGIVHTAEATEYL